MSRPAARRRSRSGAPAAEAGAPGTVLELVELEPTAAERAIEAVLAMLEDAEVPATRDAGAFYPHPIGVLVGLPELVKRTLSARTYTVPVLVVSGDPLNRPVPVDRLYRVADACAGALSIDTYRPSSFSGSANAEPLPALELTATLTVLEES